MRSLLRIRHLVRKVLPAALLLLSGPLLAQTGALTVSWDSPADPDIIAHRVRFGQDPLNLTGSTLVPVPQTSVLLTGLVPQVSYTVEVTAISGSGCESMPSAQVTGTSSNAGPECTAVSTSGQFLQGRASQTVTLSGVGFEPGPTVRFFKGAIDPVPISVVSQTLVDPSTLRVTVSTAPQTPLGDTSVLVANADTSQPPALCSENLVVSFNPSRADVDGSGRVEGIDIALLAVVFGAFDGVCTDDSPNVGARGKRCDGEEDCGGTVGVSNFCSALACDTAAPSSVGKACRQETDCGGPGPVPFCLPSPYNPAVDMNGDGIIDGADLAILTPSFGQNVP